MPNLAILDHARMPNLDESLAVKGAKALSKAQQFGIQAAAATGTKNAATSAQIRIEAAK
jgi:hypothetical protein